MEKLKTQVTAKSYIRKKSGHFTITLPKKCIAFHVINSGTDIMIGDYPLKPGQTFTGRSMFLNDGRIPHAIVFTVWKGCAFVLTTEIQKP